MSQVRNASQQPPSALEGQRKREDVLWQDIYHKGTHAVLLWSTLLPESAETYWENGA